MSSELVRQWLAKRGREVAIGYHREMHGCMVAWEGKGLVFFDENDPPEVRRFAIAHELGHFFLDHLLPRRRALDFFGEGIRNVLDQKRPATREESLTAVLEGVPIGVQIHLMDRGPTGDIGKGTIARSEMRADRLALEWLAPSTHARQVMQDGPQDTQEQRLAAYFGLPLERAETYARILRGEQGRSRFSIVSFLGEEPG
ncbi:ImmA/IrrE family metallo-endopeptidase [Corallococcus exiguus]|nr:ImmA/IrrE family metallo-endopeptidase [Corallococcus exiguus]